MQGGSTTGQQQLIFFPLFSQGLSVLLPCVFRHTSYWYFLACVTTCVHLQANIFQGSRSFLYCCSLFYYITIYCIIYDMFPTYCTFLVYILVQHHMGRPKKQGTRKFQNFRGRSPFLNKPYPLPLVIVEFHCDWSSPLFMDCVDPSLLVSNHPFWVSFNM